MIILLGFCCSIFFRGSLWEIRRYDVNSEHLRTHSKNGLKINKRPKIEDHQRLVGLYRTFKRNHFYTIKWLRKIAQGGVLKWSPNMEICMGRQEVIARIVTNHRVSPSTYFVTRRGCNQLWSGNQQPLIKNTCMLHFSLGFPWTSWTVGEFRNVFINPSNKPGQRMVIIYRTPFGHILEHCSDMFWPSWQLLGKPAKKGQPWLRESMLQRLQVQGAILR